MSVELDPTTRAPAKAVSMGIETTSAGGVAGAVGIYIAQSTGDSGLGVLATALTTALAGFATRFARDRGWIR